MAMDMSDVLLDPELVRTIPVTRATETVDTKGRTQLATRSFTVQGVVYPATEEQLQRLAEGDRSNETIAILTATPLTGGDDTHAPDTVTWKGGTYKVKGVFDWTEYGYCEVLAVSDTMQGKGVA